MKKITISMVIIAIIFISLTIFITINYSNMYINEMEMDTVSKNCFSYAGISKILHQ